jgi:hypothetical protein
MRYVMLLIAVSLMGCNKFDSVNYKIICRGVEFTEYRDASLTIKAERQLPFVQIYEIEDNLFKGVKNCQFHADKISCTGSSESELTKLSLHLNKITGEFWEQFFVNRSESKVRVGLCEKFKGNQI